jgi:YggT family protein
VLAILLQALLLQIVLFLIGFGFINPIYLFLWSVVALLGLTLNIYFVCTIVVMIASWIAPYSDNPALTLMRQLLDPLVAPFRRILPPLGGLDLSFMVFFLALQVVRIFLLPNLAAFVSMPTRLMLGF